jgi:ectoine hydroxylase-related dioxygenase (phytanoyl-CoA dioxygenase family)
MNGKVQAEGAAGTATAAEAVTKATRLLSESERDQWNEQGYIHVRGALAPDEIALLLDQLREVQRRSEEEWGKESLWEDVFDAGNDRDLSLNNAIKWCPRIDFLIDHPSIFGKVLALMGPHIQCVGSEVYVRYSGDDPLFDFHTDLGPSLRTVAPVEEKAIQLKAQFFLTDLLEPDSGNFAVVPRSHRHPFPGKIPYEKAEDRVQILAAAGDVIMFPLSLGHGVAPNKRGATRYSVIMRYAQMFCRSVDYWTEPEGPVMNRLTPRRQRLLGNLGGHSRPGDFYGMIPDQLELLYGNEFSSSIEAQAEFANFREMMSVTPYERPGIEA